MELKKNPKSDLNKKQSMFLNIGLAVSLFLVTIAFEWKVYESGPGDLGQLENEFEDLIEVPLTSQPPPPPPPVIIPPEIIEIPDEEELEEEIINLDMEMTEDMVIEDFVSEAPEEEDIDRIFEVVEEPGGPIGGRQALTRYLQEAIRYPRQARRMGLEGKVWVQFVLEKNGTITSFKVTRGIGGGCDSEAVRVLRACPLKWVPGKQRGKPVRSYFSLPIYFKLR